MGWDNTNKTMTYPLGTKIATDGTGCLQQAFGSSSKSQIYLFENGNINIFARYKPYRAVDIQSSPRDTFYSLAIGSATTTSFPETRTVAGLMSFYDDAETLYAGSSAIRANGWRYLRPRSGQNPSESMRPYDLLKMTSVGVPDQSAIGYHGTAPNPFGTYNGPSPVAITAGNLSGSQRLPLVPATGGRPEYDIMVSDLNGLDYATGNYKSGFPGATGRLAYYGLLFIPLDANDAWATSKAAKLIASTEMIDANSDSSTGKIQVRGDERMAVSYRLVNGQLDFDARKYKVYPFLTSTNFGEQQPVSITYANRSSNIPNSIKLYPIPGAEPSFVTLYNDTIEVQVFQSGTGSGSPSSGYDVSLYYTIKNNTANAISVSGLQMQFRQGTKTMADPRATGEVFYIRNIRMDDSHPSGVSDSTYSSFLSDITTIASGATVRVPAGSSTGLVHIPGECNILIGFYLGTMWHSDSITPRVPFVPPTTDVVL